MDGLVLHFDAAHDAGVIRGGDGERYPFSGADWRSGEPPLNGDLVDFEVDAGRAGEVYLIRRAAIAAPAAGPAAGAEVPREDMLAYLSRRPGLLWAALIMVSCFLPFLSVPFFAVTLFNLPNTLSFFVNIAGAFADGPASGMPGVRLAVWCVYLLYAIPIAAGWLIFRELRLEASRRLRLAVGLVALATPFVVIVLSGLIVRSDPPPRRAQGGRGEPLQDPAEMALQALSYIGIGWILLLLAGAVLVAVGCGWNPFGAGGERRD